MTSFPVRKGADNGGCVCFIKLINLSETTGCQIPEDDKLVCQCCGNHRC